MKLKNTMMMMLGAAAGIAMYMEAEKMSQNKNAIKRKINNLIDETANKMN